MRKKWSNKPLNLANRWMRFLAHIIDIFFLFTIIGGCVNIYLWLTKSTTLWHLITGVKERTLEDKPLIERQKWVRGICYFPLSLAFYAYIVGVLYLLFGDEFAQAISIPSVVVFWLLWLLGMYETWWPSPNIIEGIIRTRRVQYTKPITWLIMLIILLFAGLIALLRTS